MREELARLNRLVEDTERDPARARRRADQSVAGCRPSDPGADRDHAVVARGAVEHQGPRPVGRAHGRRRAAARRLRRGHQLPASRRCPARAASPTTRSCCPQGLVLHMDVKFPLDNYLRVPRRDHRRSSARTPARSSSRTCGSGSGGHAAGVRRSAGGTVDYVLLFIPNEQVYAFIQEQDRSILDDALRAKVVFCSPLTLFAVLAVIRQAVDNFQLEPHVARDPAATARVREAVGPVRRADGQGGSQPQDRVNAFEELEGTRRRGVERELERIDTLRRDEVAAPSPAGEPSLGVLPLALEG